MCVVSMIMDHQYSEWNWKYIPHDPTVKPIDYPTQEEIEEFKRLLYRAREYDIKHNQPDCEIEEKKNRLQKLADELGIKIDFL